MEKELVPIDFSDIELYIDYEIHIHLKDNTAYSGIVKDADDEELLLGKPETTICLGFQIDWLIGAYVSKEDYSTVMNED